MAEDNPLLKVHKAIWSMLEASSGFNALVTKEANKIKYTGTDHPKLKTGTLNPSDFPEIRITRTLMNFNLEGTSDRSNVSVLWELQIKTDDDRDIELSDLEWEILRAMLGWDEHLKTLTWAGKTFVTDCSPASAKVVLSNRSKGDRGTKGWKTLWAIQTELWFETADMRLSA
jgi:hypothetical protein